MVFGIGYLWLFENNTLHNTFDGTFTFELTNLKTEGDPSPQNFAVDKPYQITWSIVLKPGDKVVKKLVLIDPT